MRRFGVVLAAAMLALGLGACDDQPEPRNEPTPRAVSADCRQAFEEAASEDGGEEAGEDELDEARYGQASESEGSFLNLLPTLDACRNSEEWFEAYRGHAMEATRGLPPSMALRSLCTRTEASGGPCEGVAPPRDKHAD